MRGPGVVYVECGGCSWRYASSSLEDLNRAAGLHDDSPRALHIVKVRGAHPWPNNRAEFRTLAKGSS